MRRDREVVSRRHCERNQIVEVFVQNEDTAAIVGTDYSWHLAVVVESVLKKPVKQVNVLPSNPSPAR
jgi:hypothetical protein